jgi:N-methylhydantoinase A
MLASDLRHDAVQTHFARADAVPADELAGLWRSLEERLLATFADEGMDPEQVTFVRSADMRYSGQEHTVNVPIPEGTDGGAEEVERRFHELHDQLYTFRLTSPIEFVNFRLTALGAVRKPELARIASDGDVRAALKGTRDVDFDELGRQESRIYERSRLGAGTELEGPAVIEEPAASTVVFPRQRLLVDEYGNLIIDTEVA